MLLCSSSKKFSIFKSLQKKRRERAATLQRKNRVPCSIFMSSVLNPTGISAVIYFLTDECFGAFYLTDTMVVIQFKNRAMCVWPY